MNDTESLRQKLTEKGYAFLCEEPMSLHTSFHVGGPAEIFITPSDEVQAAQVFMLCREHSIPTYVVGNGSNLLICDDGLRGVVIAFTQSMSRITRCGNTLTAQAGATLSQLCSYARQEGLSGLEFAYGIPGSVGGAVYMNAGAYGGEMKDVVETVRCVDQNGAFYEVPNQDAGFAYRFSNFQNGGQIILSAVFALTPDAPEAIDQRMKEILNRRVSKQPLEFPSAGSAFKRPEHGFAAALIEECGLKGYTVGGAQVSTKHAGFVINIGGATCSDVLAVLSHVKETVFRQKGIMLEAEVRQLI